MTPNDAQLVQESCEPFTPAIKSAWLSAYATLSGAMQEAAVAAAARKPTIKSFFARLFGQA
jgi:hypothetical protein